MTRPHLTNLRTSAEQIAKLVCGGQVLPGKPPPGLSYLEMKVAWDFIHPLAEEGLSNEEILQELRKDSSLKYMLGKLGRELTTDEIGRLKVSIDRLVEHLVKHTPT